MRMISQIYPMKKYSSAEDTMLGGEENFKLDEKLSPCGKEPPLHHCHLLHHLHHLHQRSMSPGLLLQYPAHPLKRKRKRKKNQNAT
jgi:hypothetical protein